MFQNGGAEAVEERDKSTDAVTADSASLACTVLALEQGPGPVGSHEHCSSCQLLKGSFARNKNNREVGCDGIGLG